jgi:hypothetical protein
MIVTTKSESRMNPDPDPGYVSKSGFFYHKKLQIFAIKHTIFKIKNTLFLVLGLNGGLLTYRRSPQPQQSEHLSLPNMKFLAFLWVIFSFYLSRSGSVDPIESGTDPNPQYRLEHFSKE